MTASQSSSMAVDPVSLAVSASPSATRQSHPVASRKRRAARVDTALIPLSSHEEHQKSCADDNAIRAASEADSVGRASTQGAALLSEKPVPAPLAVGPVAEETKEGKCS